VRRPEVSPARIQELRNRLEREVAAALAELPTVDHPLVVTGQFLRSAAHRHAAPPADGPRSRPQEPGPVARERGGDITYAAARDALVGISFRRLVSSGTVGRPFDDGMAALETGGRAGVVEWIRQLAPSRYTELCVDVDRLGHHLADRWPRLDPRWLPRTAVPMRVRLLGGAVVLSCRPDLLVGRPDGQEGGVGLVELRTDERHAFDRTVLSFSVLVETLRSTAPPFVGATYYVPTGEMEVVPVTYEVVEDAARQVADAIATTAGPGTGVTGLPSARQVPNHGGDAGAMRTVTGRCAHGTAHRNRRGTASPTDLRLPPAPTSPRRNRR